MSLVPHKYTPAEMSEQELIATFAAREHTVDFLVKSLRDQIHSGTLSSYVITGPRGAGKSTIIQMVVLHIRQNPKLNAAWIPVIFPEEQFNLISLRDLLEAILLALSKQKIPIAQEWLFKVKAELDEEQSQQLAITGLREIARQAGKRLILFIENLDQFLGRNLDDQMKGTLRRLLMSEPFMMIIGSTVHVFDSLKDYDQAFFNYFGQVPLNRLNPDQVSELLKKRAEYDHNDNFLRELPQQQAKVRTLVHLTGGNPRFVLMLYELLSLQKVTTIVQYLRRLVDELTPLLKDEMERLPGQQQKIIHALMEKGGTAQPADLTEPTRLPLNAITAQLKRLKEAQIVEVLGGGKGRAANYTIPDKLFSIWYQMRYLSQNRRRIELFVEVLRIWFEEEKRIEALRDLAARKHTNSPHALRECATTAEYFAASLKGTKHELLATDLCISSWLKTDLKEAAFAYADLGKMKTAGLLDEPSIHTALAGWCTSHDDPQRAIDILDQVLTGQNQINVDTLAWAMSLRAILKGSMGDNAGALADASSLLKLNGTPKETMAWAYFVRGVVYKTLNSNHEALAAFNSLRDLGDINFGMEVQVLAYRGDIKREINDKEGALIDYNAALKLKDVPEDLVADILIDRGTTKGELEDHEGAISDFSSIIAKEGISGEHTVRALVNRGFFREKLEDFKGAISDYSMAIEFKDAPKEGIARALINRGMVKAEHKDMKGAFADFDLLVKNADAPKEQFLQALLLRGLCFSANGNIEAATNDWVATIRQSDSVDNFLPNASQIIIRTIWKSKDQNSIISILQQLTTSLNTLATNVSREITLRILSRLAAPEMKEAWIFTWQYFSKVLKQDIMEAIKFLEPVYDVLGGKNHNLLDALPPEQREFASEVLAKFDFPSSKKPAKYTKTKKSGR